MPGLLERAASRFLGLPTRESVLSLQSEINSLQTRMRMRPSASGVEIQYGQFDYEYVEALKGDDRWDVYDKMESDPLIKEGLDAVVLPLCTGKWEIQAASDKAKDKEIAEFVSANLLRETSDRFGREYFIQTSWTGQRLVEILDFLKCGFAMFAKSTREVNGKIIYDRIQWLEPRSVDPRGWMLSETDEIVAVNRTYQTPKPEFKFMEPIPARQLVLYPWDFKGARYEGRPKIRSLYGAFIRKDAMVRFAAIWAQKTGAPMPVGYYPDSYTPAQKAVLEQVVMQMRGQAPAEAYAMLPMGPDGVGAKLGYAGMDGAAAQQPDRMRGLINGENSEIAHGSNTKSRLLGETKSGSRSVGETQSEDEDVNVDAVVSRICGIENDGIANLPGVIQELVDWNYPGVKRYPKLTCPRVGPREDFRTLDPLIKSIVAGITPLTPAVRKQVTEKLGVNLKDDEYDIEAPQLDAEDNPVPPSLNPKDKVPPSGRSKRSKTAPGGNGDGGAQTTAEDEKAGRSLTLRLGMERMLRLPDGPPVPQPKGYGRTPTQFEARICMLGMVAGTLTTGGDQLGSALRRATAKMIEDILGRIETGKIKREATTGLRRSRPKGEPSMVAGIRDRFLEVAQVGRQHAREELAKQKDIAKRIKSGEVSRSSVALSDTFDETPPGDPNILPAGATIPKGSRAAAEIEALIEEAGGSWQVISTLTAELAGEARVASQIAVDEIWARLLDEAIREYNAAMRSGMDEAQALKQVELALHGLSPAKQDLAARQVAEVAYNQGRDMAAKEAAVTGDAQWVVRSEVLDQRTCATCAQLDGVYLKIGTREYEQYLPPARCEGGDNCRGFAVIVSDELAKQLEAEG